MKIYKPMTEERKAEIDKNDERGYFDWQLWFDGLTWYGKLCFYLGV